MHIERTEFLSELQQGWVWLHSSIWHVNDLNKGVAEERASLHRGDISLKENGLTFNHWNPLHLKLRPSVDSDPVFPQGPREHLGCAVLRSDQPLHFRAWDITLSCWTWFWAHRRHTVACIPGGRQQSKHCCLIQQRHSSRKSEKGSPFVVWSLLTLPHVLWFKCVFPSLSLMSSHPLFSLNPLKMWSHFPFYLYWT